MTFDGKVVVVTGAGSGIGRGFAIGFARDGAHVVGIGRNEADLARTAEMCGPGKMHWIAGSVAVETDVDRLFSETLQRFGKIDVLLNNAALYPKAGFLESTFRDWARVIETNVLGMALCCHKALPGMLEQRYGRILNIGSFAWRRPIPAASAYSVSKAAVAVLTKAIVAEIDRENYPDVLVNTLVPGMFKTRMSQDGEDPMSAYPHARFVASLPPGGPTGATFSGSELWVEHAGVGLRTELRRFLLRIIGR
jgi:NAD(P)-dependent dehydrogenase (short-subunit alcohol dehydrogenase family)